MIKAGFTAYFVVFEEIAKNESPCLLIFSLRKKKKDLDQDHFLKMSLRSTVRNQDIMEEWAGRF